MIKRILAMLLVVTMTVSLGTVMVGAIDPDPQTIEEAVRKYAVEELGLSGAAIDGWLEKPRSLDVPTDMQVKEHGTSEWKEGPITIEERTTDEIPQFDFQAIVDMATVKDAFDDYVNTATHVIEAVGGEKKADLLGQLEEIAVTGEFTVKIVIPEGLTVDEAVINDQRKTMEGFNAEAKTIFHEKERSLSDNVVTIKIGVGGTETAAADKATKAELDTYLGADLIFDYLGAQPTQLDKTYQVKGEFSGSTNIGGIADIDYASEPLGTVEGTNHNPDKTEAPVVSATVKVERSGGSGGGGGGASSTVKVEFVVEGEVIKTVTGISKVTVTPSEVVPEAREGFEFVGWYLDKELTKPATDPLEVSKDTTLYAKWTVAGGPVLNTDDHFAYVIGYTDGTVRPLNNILREEVATIFFRLLTEEAGEALHEEVAPYSDVPETKWSSTAIATLSKGGYITGRPDGTFGPENYITRAEFATIAARFTETVGGEGVELNDIDGHWAKNYIEACAASGLITGYTDGSFRPDQYITRAEAMAIVNRLLGRAVDAEGISAVEDDIYYFEDNAEETWCYYIVLEATNSHDFTRAEGEEYETWTKVTEVRDWAAYEK